MIYDATKNQVTHRLTFSGRDANVRDAINHYVLIRRFSALVKQGKPIPKPLGEYILAMLDSRTNPARRPINPQAALHKLAMGAEVEWRVSKGMKYEAAVSEVRDWMPVEFGTKRGSKPSTGTVKAAHTMYLRTIKRIPRRGGKRRRQLSK